LSYRSPSPGVHTAAPVRARPRRGLLSAGVPLFFAVLPLTVLVWAIPLTA